MGYEKFKARRGICGLGAENMNRLPLLGVDEPDGGHLRVGQSAAIERLVAGCLGLLGESLVLTTVTPQHNPVTITVCPS
jgi:hypothetical protein